MYTAQKKEVVFPFRIYYCFLPVKRESCNPEALLLHATYDQKLLPPTRSLLKFAIGDIPSGGSTARGKARVPVFSAAECGRAKGARVKGALRAALMPAHAFPVLRRDGVQSKLGALGEISAHSSAC